MFSQVLLQKLVAAATVIVGTGVGIGYAAHNTWVELAKQTPSSASTINTIVAVNNADNHAALTEVSELINADRANNYLCKLSGSNKSASKCDLTLIPVTKHWVDITDIKQTRQSTPITPVQIAAQNAYLKLDVDPAFFSIININKQALIDVVLAANPSKKFATLDVMFKVDDSGAIYDKSTHLLGVADSRAAQVSELSTVKCPFNESESDTAYAECTFYDFGDKTASYSSATYANQIPTNLLTATTAALAPNKNYLFKYQNALPKNILGQNTRVVVKGLDSGSYAEKVAINHLVPVIVHGTTTNTAFILSEHAAHSIIVAKTAALEANKTIAHTLESKNYQCKFDTTIEDCNLVPLVFSDAKTSFDLSAIKAAELTADLTVSSSPTPPQYFKVEVDHKFIANFQSELSAKTLEIVENTSEQPKITSLTPILSIDESGTTYFDKSNFIFDSTGLANSANLTSGQVRWCSFATGDQASDAPKKCFISELTITSSSIDAAQDFKKPTSEATSIAQNKTYLVHYLDDPYTSGIPFSDISTQSKFFIQEIAASATTPKTDVANFAANKVHPAILFDAADDKQYAFILK